MPPWHTILAALSLATAAHAQVRFFSWDSGRGGCSSLASGACLGGLRNDIQNLFEPSSIFLTSTISPASIQNADFAILGVIRTLPGDDVSPLSTAEQNALLAWVQSGGRLLIITDDTTFQASGNSLTNPFSVTCLGTLPASQFASPVLSCSSLTGPFGSTGQLEGSSVGWYSSTGPNSHAAYWSNFTAAVLSGIHGSGRVAFLADTNLVSANWSDNVTARRNLLVSLGLRPRTLASVPAICPGQTLTFQPPFPVSQDATYQWRRNGQLLSNGATPSGSIVSGAQAHQLIITSPAAQDAGDYDCIITSTCYTVTLYPATVSSCCANCDGSTQSPLLTANDFQCFISAFAAGSLYANCDASTGTPTLTANDFQCFINAYASGCS